jgi:hypothetical protein
MSISKTRAVGKNLVLAVAVVLLALGSSAVAALEGEQASKGLFAASGVRGTIDRSGEPTVIRARYVDPNLDLLLGADGTPYEVGAGSTLTLNLFDDTVLVADLDRVEPNYGGGFTWVGRVQDEPLSLVTLVVNDGVMAGTVALPKGLFEISYAGNGVHAVHEIDQSAFPPEAEPILVEVPEGELADAVPAAVADDGSEIDVMVVYTPMARVAQGGTAAMLNLINSAVSQTNSSYANSQITQRLNLVHTAEVSYTESGDIVTDLYRLRDVDGFMDNVHTLRDLYDADDVALLVEYPSTYRYCGVAFLLNSLSTSWAPNAFAVIERNCATGNYSFAHELGHNMGAHHDWYVNDSTVLYTYSHGKVNTPDRWYTIMSYYAECSDKGVYCNRVPYWSNPNVTYGGDPMGVPAGTSTSCNVGDFNPNCDADNHLTLNNTAWTVANFRISARPPSAPTGLAATAVSPLRIDLSWTDTSSDETGFRIERRPLGGSWSTIATLGANTTSYPDTGVTPDSTYYYRVVATNTYGDSDPSNTASATTPPVIIGPLVYDGHIIDDDNAGGTSGNDNGYVDCGETVGLVVILRNEGNTAAEGIDTTLSFVDDTYIFGVGNVTSGYPDIGGGASTGNTQSFEFSVEADAEHGHWVDLELEISADNWGPGSVTFDFPILCSATADYRHYFPVILR